MESTVLAKASKVGVPQEDKRTSSFSCQACKAKKVKCSRTFPCDKCVKLGIDCVPQSRKRGRPSEGGKNGETTEFSRFNSRLKTVLKDLVQFIKNSPDAAKQTRILDFVKVHLRRRRMRKLFLLASVRAYDKQPDSAQFLKQWFGTDVPLHLLTGGDDTTHPFGGLHMASHRSGELHMASLRKSLDQSRDSIAECMLSVGIADIEGYIGDEKPRTDFTESLDLDRTWIPSTMKALLEPTAFPGASVMVEFQVDGHQSYSVNKEFTNKFYTETEMLSTGPGPGFPWGSRKIFQVQDRCELISHEMTDMLTKQSDQDSPMEYNDLMKMLDRHGTCLAYYMRRYFWLEEGGDRCCTIFILYPISADCKHLAKDEPSDKPKRPAKKKSVTTKLPADPAACPIPCATHPPISAADQLGLLAPIISPDLPMSTRPNGYFSNIQVDITPNASSVCSEGASGETAGLEGSSTSCWAPDESFDQLLGLLLDDADQETLDSIFDIDVPL